MTAPGNVRALGRDDASWTLLSALADLLARGAATGVADWRTSRGDFPNHVQISITNIPRTEAEYLAGRADPDRAFGLAESSAMRWSERAVAYWRAASGQTPEAPSTACPSCRATPGQHCVPTHAGERDSGAWSHPSRGVDERTPKSWPRQLAALYVQEPHRLRGLPEDVARDLVTLAGYVHGGGGSTGVVTDLWTGWAGALDNMMPDTAIGEALERLALVAGLHRHEGTEHPETDESLRSRVLAAFRGAAPE